MNLIDTGEPVVLAREILPQPVTRAAINKLKQRMEFAWSKGEIPTTNAVIQYPRVNWHTGKGFEERVPLRQITLGDAAIWARNNGFPVRDEILELLPPDTTQSTPPGRGGKWPWGDYETPLLQILAEAVNHFCLAGDYPKKESGEVVQWVRERMEQAGLPSSDTLADRIETIISPRHYSHHRQRKPR